MSFARRCGAATLKGLISDETMIGQVESHRDKVGNLPYAVPQNLIFASEPERPFEVYVLQL